MYPKFFTGQSKISLRKIAKNERSINYRNLSCKILLFDGRFYEFDLFKIYDILLENLLTEETIVNSANIDQISFIIDLMYRCDESKLINVGPIKDKSYFYNAFLTKAKRVFLDTKKNPEKRTNNFSPSKFKEYLSKDQQGVL